MTKKLTITVLVNILGIYCTSVYAGVGSASGYSYGVGPDSSQFGHRYTDFTHSNNQQGYSNPEAYADFKTIKVIHEHGSSGTGNNLGSSHAGGSSSIGGFSGIHDSHGSAYSLGHNLENTYSPSYSSGGGHVAAHTSHIGHSSLESSNSFGGLSGGYGSASGLGGYSSAGHNDGGNVRVIRVIHEFNRPKGYSHSSSYSHGSSGKGKKGKSFHAVHDGSGPHGSSSHSSGGHGGKTIKIIHEQVTSPDVNMGHAYIPYDHLNAYNGEPNTFNGGFSNSVDNLKSLKAIGLFSNLGAASGGFNAHSAPNVHFAAPPHEHFPPLTTSGGWKKKK